MKILGNNYFIAIIFLIVVCLSGCRNDSSEKVEKEDCGDIVKEIVIEEGKLLSPEWLVKVMDEYEKEAIELHIFYLYIIQVFEYKQKTYVRIHESLYSGSSGRDDYYTCSGNKICECKGVLYSQTPLCQELSDANTEQGYVKTMVFDALFCYGPKTCDNIGTTYRYSFLNK